MMLKGMSMMRRLIGRIVAVATLAAGLAMDNSASAESWKPALHDADDLHEAAEDLHDRAHRLHADHAIPITAALEQVTSDLHQGMKRQDCIAEIVPLLNRTEQVLNETAAVVSLSHELRTDRKATAQLADARHHFEAAAEHIECILHEHGIALPRPHTHWEHSFAPSHPGTQYPQVPAWTTQPSRHDDFRHDDFRHGGQPYGPSYYYQPRTGYYAPAPPQKLPRVVISGVLTQ